MNQRDPFYGNVIIMRVLIVLTWLAIMIMLFSCKPVQEVRYRENVGWKITKGQKHHIQKYERKLNSWTH